MRERRRFDHLRACLLATALTAFPLIAQAGGALPANGNYVAGKGTITGAGSGLTINQSSTAGIIDWSSFSIGQGNAVQFNNGSGATLNRVTGGDIARIGGNLSATGSIFLIDPQGVVISGSGKVVTGGSFVGSTRDISNSDFMSGTMHFTGSSQGNAVNRGQIRSNGGDAVLIGNSVQNTGTLSAPNGTAGMAAGNDVLLQPVGGDQRVFVKGGTGDVRNSGTIAAASAELKAANGNVYSLAGNNGGVINATGTQIINGHVWLTSNTGKVTVNGNVSAKNANGSGGAVTVRGSNIDVGGRIDAAAIAAGRNGGDVSIIAAETTNVGGTIKAGGGQGAKGGFVETSGAHLHVADSASINTLSLGGASGTWLIDPNDFTIAASGGDMTGAALSASLLTTDVSISSDDGATAGNGDIFVNDAVSWSDHTLTLTALRNIEVNAGLTVGGAGTLDLTAANAIAINHTVQVTGAGTINLNAGLDTTTIPGASLLELSFANGASIDYGATDNGGSLNINATAYTLLYKLADSTHTAPDSGTDDIAGIDATDDSGHYALATNLDGTGATFTSALAGAGSNAFSGTFEGLGNTITGLTITDTVDSDLVGLFGRTSASTIRDLGLIDGSITAGANAAAGGLVASNYGASGVAIVANDYFSGSVSSDHDTSIGGLVGVNDGGDTGGLAVIVNSHASGTVGAIGYTNIGGLIGVNSDDAGSALVTQSFSTSNVQGGDGANVGGLVGAAFGGSISNSYATGTVVGADGGAWVGGFIGWNPSGSISDAYATGAVTTGLGGSAGGFAGFSDGTITNAYATGVVSAGSGSTIGGFAGFSDGTVTNAYWDTLTSGQSSDGAQATGAGSINGFDPATGSIGLTTAQLQGLSTLSGGGLFDISTAFSNPLWGGGSGGLYPYLLLQFPSGTPQAIGGIAYSDAGITPLGAGNTVSAFMNGADLNSVLTGGTVTTGANGYYYYLLAPGTLANSQVLATTASGAALGEDTSATLPGFDIFGGALNDFTSVTSYATELSERAANLSTAEGGNLSLASFVAGLSGFYLTSTAPSFSIDTAPDLSSDIFISDNAPGGVLSVDVPISWSSANTLTLSASNDISINEDITATNGGLVLDALGAISATGAINVGTFTLQNGAWSQLSATLPAFAAANFQLRDGTFLRALGGDGSSGAPYQITDVYGLQGIIGFLSDDFVLANDIDATGTAAWNSGAGFTSLGDFLNPYEGTFDGAGFTIDGLAIVSTADASVVGLFGDNAGTVQNVNLTNVSMSQTGDSAYLGGIAGENDGTILNATVSGTLTGGDFAGVGGVVGLNTFVISGSSSTADVSAGDGGVVGGLVAANLGGIDTSFATGAVSDIGDLALAGGLAGANFGGSILQSYATGTVDVTGDDAEAGGLLGENDGLVSESYATGTVTVTNIAAIPDGGDVGGLVGDNAGDISSSYATGNVIAIGDHSDAGGLAGFQCSCSTIEESYASGAVSVTGDFANAGGLIGENEGDITQSYADGSVSVSGDSADAGGFVGDHVSGTVLQSYATAPVSVTGDDAFVGAMAGNNRGFINQSYATGLVSATGASELTGGFAAENDGVIRNSYWDEDSTGQGATGIGNDTSAITTLVGLTSSSGSTAFARSSYANFSPFNSVWYMIDGQTRPFLRWEYSTGIANAHQLQLMAMDLTASYTLQNNIDLGSALSDASGMWSAAGFVPIGRLSNRFTGNFTGQGYTIDGLFIDRAAMDGVGLFGATSAAVTIGGVNLTNANVTGHNDVGSLAGINLGTIQNLSSSTGVTVSGNSRVGGLAGHNSGSIDEASVSGTVNGTIFTGGLIGYNDLGTSVTSSSAGGTVTGTGNYVGGFAGFNNGDITQATATADANGVADLGGLVGYNAYHGIIDGSSASGDVTGSGNFVGGVAGFNTGQIQNLSLYTGSTVGGVSYVGGLAGYSGPAGGIDNSSASGTITGSNKFVGGVAGYNAGTIANGAAYTGGTISGASQIGGVAGQNGGSIANATSNATLSGTTFIGGLVGYNNPGATITASSASGTATGTGNFVGGLVAYNVGSITQSASTAGANGVSYVGGLVGFNAHIISQSYARGAVVASGDFAGGLVGENGRGTIDQSYATGTVSGGAHTGGLLGYNAGGGSVITYSYWDSDTPGVTQGTGGGNSTGISALTDVQFLGALPTGFATADWAQDSGINGGFPYLLAL